MSTNLQNSIWPNTDGNLGNIKVQIPTGTANDPWPTGDALVHNFVFDEGKLVGFVDTKALIANDSKSTTFPYDYVNVFLPSITGGEMTYNYDQCTYVVLNGEVIKGDVPIEIITEKYLGCKTVDDIKVVDPNYLTNDIIDGVWSEGLGDLTDGKWMFEYCFDLTSFKSDLSSLTDGYHMFYNCANLATFTSDLPNLTNGYYMFYSCSQLTSFKSDLSSLTDGEMMFEYCGNLTSFKSDLSSLTDGYYMFYGCKLDTASVQNIADTINTYSGIITISIGNYTPNEQEIAAFNKMVSKGWTVYVSSFNGDFLCFGNSCCATCCASLTTLDETGSEFIAPKPYWAKPVPSDEKHAQYVDEQGNYYNILGAQFIYGDNLETYGMFTSEEDAAAQMRLTKIGEEEIETA